MQNCYMITSICISLLYEFLKIPISVIVYVICDSVSMHVFLYKICFPLSVKLSTGF